MKNKGQLILNIYCISFIIVIFIATILYNFKMFNFDTMSIVLIGYGIIGFILYIINLIKLKTVPLWNIIIVLIFLFIYLSWRFAYNQKVALIGLYDGREGALVISSYYIILLVFSLLHKEEIKKTIFIILTLNGIMQSFYSLFQLLCIPKILFIPINNYEIYSTGFFYNSNIFGSFIVMIVGLWIPKYFFEDKKLNIAKLLITLLLITSLLSSGAMSAYVAMIFILLLVIAVYLIKKLDIKPLIFFEKFSILLGSLFIIILLINSFNNKLSNDITKTNYEFIQVVSGKWNNEFGTGRVYIWKEALKYFKNYIWTGIGIDNFPYIGFKSGTFIYDSPLENNIITKAHNEYIQILVTGGIFLLTSYCCLIVFIIIKSFNKIKKDNYNLFYSFFFAFISYLVQAFFNIRMMLIAPLFFLIGGLLISTNQ